VCRGTLRVLHDFSDLCPVVDGRGTQQLTMGSDPVWMGRGPRQFLGLRCGPRVFLYSLSENVVYLDFTASTEFLTTLMTAPSDDYFLFDRYVFHTWPAEYQTTLGMARFFEHGSLGQRESDMFDVWNTVDFSGAAAATLVSYRLDTGERTTVIGRANGWPYPPSGTHISSIAPGRPGWAAVSVIGTGAGQGTLDNEIVWANVETGEVCRVAHNRTSGDGCPWDYWREPHVTISPSGTRAVFASDWGCGSTVDTYVVDLRKQ